MSTVPFIRQRVTFNVSGALLFPEADEAVTVTFEEPAGVPVAGAPPVELSGGGEEESLPPQPAVAITTSSSNPVHRR
ncbi:protein of unknown function [Nitrospira japonica]|uniref:Uncharacterized protein n=1 Tax=Nitrospira japonica TaxID=1325564 RepID=A0A1W1I7K3_9BACT|nr:protein of unknown function [Nitrospira japonica]